MNNIKVRLPRESDAGRVEELLLYIAKLHRDGRSDLFIDAGAKFGRDEILALFADDDSPVFVAEDGEGYVIGYIICRMKSSAGNPSLKPVKRLYIEDLCVDPEYSGRGAGRALMARAEEYARAAGCHNLELNVWEFNSDAIEFYRKNGYTEQRRIMEKLL